MNIFVTTSHGADFFGEDRHLVKSLTSLADYARGCLPADEREPLVQLLAAQQAVEVGTEQAIPAAEAEAFAGQFRRIARHHFLRSTRLRQAAAFLADSAGRAAADGQPWTWRTEAA
ncbi:hypothetical protein [Streptomyces erythrochromogenes]|uniref:DUF7739 domain-containing protein n=1 Tax=Streptomyces erythrochromogenes TaxID=285574 RepID=UPI002F908D9A|nr:hypothetical protein OG489_40170 [Streptomyces erythrochromogenes]WSR88910.1 hypothetical protein OG489_40020 [Streptomyces erythrochromogenes]